MITDDHPFFRLGVHAVLETGGHSVVASANDAGETLAAIKDSKPEIILLDIRLPGTDGISLLRDLRAKGDERAVIILTVELTDEQLLAAIQLRVNGIVFKHEGEKQLLKAIAAVQNGMRFIDAKLMDKALEIASSASTASRLAQLTAKEREIAHHVASGMRNREIASSMGTTEGTVKVYLHNIYSKFSISNRAELAALIADEKQ